MSDNYVAESRKLWRRDRGDVTTDDLKLGCLQRIADATEVMAKNHAELIQERDRYKRLNNEKWDEIAKLHRMISGLKGYIRRLKKGGGKG